MRYLLALTVVVLAGCTRDVDTPLERSPALVFPEEDAPAADASDIRASEMLLRRDWARASEETKNKFLGRLRRALKLPPGTDVGLGTFRDTGAPLRGKDAEYDIPARDEMLGSARVPGGKHAVRISIRYPVDDRLEWKPYDWGITFDNQANATVVARVVDALSRYKDLGARRLYRTADPDVQVLATYTTDFSRTETRRLFFLGLGKPGFVTECLVVAYGRVGADHLYVTVSGQTFRAYLAKQEQLTQLRVRQDKSTGSVGPTTLSIDSVGTLVLPGLGETAEGRPALLNGKPFRG